MNLKLIIDAAKLVTFSRHFNIAKLVYTSTNKSSDSEGEVCSIIISTTSFTA